ncbi:hypothetical protein [Thauera sinica]|uniref:Uncharacterized protein n=1 Tax=Thauera sinica TaxID=2665146 RepID=A0ABW1ART3_9RHOO|nr:hypothetical protein [Thauera sp. K11]ATE62824.1 hypothetical protein CCZ27_21190 [Thauera sp. K11]
MNFRNPADCLNLLRHLHPTDVVATHATLSEMTADLLEAMPAPNQHLELLEAARDLLVFTQTEMARRYAAHPLAPGSADHPTLVRVVSLWKNLARSYAQISRDDAGQGTLDDQRALLAQRRLYCAGMVVLEYFRAHQEVPRGCWAEIHECYAAAVQANMEGIRVADPLNEVWKAQSTREAYVSVLLVDLANPYGRDERELNWILRWAQRFAPYCSLTTDLDNQKANVYAVDLGGDRGLGPIGLLPRTSSLIRFDGSALASQIRGVLAQFKQGVKPASLGLGEDCSRDAGARLLLSLYRPWGLSSSGRRFPRRAAEGNVALTGDWLAIGFGVGGMVFEQPRFERPRGNVREDISLLTFGERVPRADPPSISAFHDRQREAERLGLACEPWKLLDQSVGGFRVEQTPGAERVGHHQLVGVRPHDSEHMLLGQISWLMFRNDGRLEAGVHLLSGMPRMAAVRPVVTQGRLPAFQQGFALPANPALKTEASLILPGPWYQRGREIDIREDDGAPRRMRLTKLMLRGANFDQVCFEPAAISPE